MKTKACSRCAHVKPLIGFKPDVRFSSGRRPECRKCAAPARRLEGKRYRNTPNGRKTRIKCFNRYINTDAGKIARRETAKRVRIKLKLEALTAYSKGKPKCICCGIARIEFLSIDHINGNGRKHRDAVCGGQGGTDFYLFIGGYVKTIIRQGFAYCVSTVTLQPTFMASALTKGKDNAAKLSNSR